MRTQPRKIAFAGFWILLIAVLSFLPQQFKQDLHTRGHLHVWGHLLAFCSATLLLVRATRDRRFRIVLLLMVLALGGCLEFAQHLVYSSPIEWSDVVIDTLGSALGLLFALALGLRFTGPAGALLPGRSLPGTSLPGASIPGTSIPSASIPGTSLPDASLPGRSLPGRSLPGRFLR